MARGIGENAVIAKIRLEEQGANPDTPDAGYVFLFFKADGLADGLYMRVSDGTVYGPVLGEFFELGEVTTPDMPAANRIRLFASDDGGGITRLYTLDADGYNRLVPNAFVDLVDAPAEYVGSENRAVRVDGFGQALTFALRAETHNSVGNVGAGEDNLHSATLPADFTFAVDGDVVRFMAGGTFANTANNKRVRVKLGATTIFDSGALATTTAQDWLVEGWITRTGASAEKFVVKFLTSDTGVPPQVNYGTAAENPTTDLTLQCTGEATANNDVVQEVLFVEKI